MLLAYTHTPRSPRHLARILVVKTEFCWGKLWAKKVKHNADGIKYCTTFAHLHAKALPNYIERPQGDTETRDTETRS